MGVLGRGLSHGALEQTGKVGDIRDTYLLCCLCDRVVVIPEQVRRKLDVGQGHIVGQVAVYLPCFLRCAENECLLRVEKHSGNMLQLSNPSTVR